MSNELQAEGDPCPNGTPLEQLNEEQLVLRAQSGETAALAILFDRYYERVFRFAHRFTDSSDIATEIVQDTFIAALNHIHHLRNPNGFAHWLFLLARHVAQRRR